MKQICSRGTAFLLAVVLMVFMVPQAMAQMPVEEPTPIETASAAPVLRYVGKYKEGMIRVTDGTLWGYADPSGTVRIKPQFEQAEEFYLGCALVTKNGKVGLLRWDGEFILEPEYDELTNVGYGVYLAKRGEVWDLLSVTSIVTSKGTTHQLYADQATAYLTTGSAVQQLIMRNQDGELTRILVSSLPQFLQERRVPGWQFPLSASRTAAFRDVAADDWYDRWVNLAYSVGLMEGIGGGEFGPLYTLSVAETLRLAACLESRARQDDFHLQSVSGSPWYRSSVVYCEASGIIEPGEFREEDLVRPVTRAEMAYILSATTPVRSMEYRNDLDHIKRNIPDVSTGDFAADAIYGLYAKGLVNGTDSAHSFCPQSSLIRAEAAAIVARIARPEQRVGF